MSSVDCNVIMRLELCTISFNPSPFSYNTFLLRGHNLVYTHLLFIARKLIGGLTLQLRHPTLLNAKISTFIIILSGNER